VLCAVGHVSVPKARLNFVNLSCKRPVQLEQVEKRRCALQIGQQVVLFGPVLHASIMDEAHDDHAIFDSTALPCGDKSSVMLPIGHPFVL